MKYLKRIISIFLCFVVLITAFTVHSSAFAVTVASGTYVAYSILVAALAACGVAVAASNVSPGTFQSILDSPGAEDVKALIGATAVLANSGSTYFHWTSSEWATFTSWVTGAGFLEGSVVVPAQTQSFIPSTSFNGSLLSSYITAPTPTTNGIIGWNVGNCTARTWHRTSSSTAVRIDLTNGFLFGSMSTSLGSGNLGYGYYLMGSPVVVYGSDDVRCFCGWALTEEGRVARTTSEIAKSGICAGGTLNAVYNERNVSFRFYNGILQMQYIGTWYSIAPTANFEISYTSLAEYFTDVINTGALVGDFGGIGNDVVNPADNTDDVGIDVYPPIAIPNGNNALPLDLGDGQSIDIPLDPYLDRQTVSPGDDVIISNPPDWTDTVIDNTPEDIQPRVKVNPDTDVAPGDVSVPWSDEQSWPVAYPDTVTGDLTDAPPYVEAPPEADSTPRDNTNRMKLSALWLSKFPFCIPWDLKQGVSQLLAPAEAPVFDIPFKNARLGIDENIHIDFSQFESVASVSRWFFSATWVIILIMLTKKMIWK